MTSYSDLSDKQLVTRLLGVRESRRSYRGSLRELFAKEPLPEKCAVARELIRRMLREEISTQPCLTSPSAVRDYLRLVIASRQHEVFVCIWVDAQHKVIAIEEPFRGTLTQTSVYPREIVKSALQHNAAAVIFAHNHPSGLAQPSSADEQLTRNLKEALALVEVKVLDHFIVAGTTATSFAERGLL